MARSRRFNYAFWGSFAAVFAACAAILHLAVLPLFRDMPEKPSLALLSRGYLSAYYVNHTDHYLFRFGLFGFGERIRRSDLVILGSSIAEFGLSADQIGEALSARCGRPIRAFNLGMGYGEGLGFAKEVIGRNDLRDKAAVLDLFSIAENYVSPFGETVIHSNVVNAYFRIANIYADYLRDWALDGLLPRIQGGYRLGRFLQSSVFRLPETGDVLLMWSGDRGTIYPETPPDMAQPLASDGTQRPPEQGGAALSREGAAFLRDRGLATILTLLPHQGYDAAEAERIALRERMPFVPVAADGLTYWDAGHHLTAAGRQLATARLAGLAPWPLLLTRCSAGSLAQ